MLAVVFLAAQVQRPAERSHFGPQFVFVEDLNRHVDLLSGKLMLTGRLDRDGNFLIEFSLPAGSARSGVPPSERINGLNLLGKKVYEFR
jgi:hypothetical protein